MVIIINIRLIIDEIKRIITFEFPKIDKNKIIIENTINNAIKLEKPVCEKIREQNLFLQNSFKHDFFCSADIFLFWTFHSYDENIVLIMLFRKSALFK